MAKKKYIDDTLSKGIKTITKDQNSIWGIDTIQAYLHNNQFSPSTETLLTTWDNIQEFTVTFARKGNLLRINRLVGLLENWVTR